MEGPARFQLHLVTERLGQPEWWLPRVSAAVAGGVDWVQLRDKSASALELYEHVTSLRDDLAAVERPAPVRLSVNDRLDVALASQVDGVHLAGKSLPVRLAHQLVQDRLLLGRSVHSLDEAVQAAADGADYVTFGHVFPTHSKPGLPPRGTEQLAEIVAGVPVPVLAIGGIDLANLDQVLATGCAGIAVISAILSAADPACAAGRLRAALDASPHRPRRPFPIGRTDAGCRPTERPTRLTPHDS